MINHNIEIIVTAVEGDQIKIGINAPSDVVIHRKEVLEAIQQSNREAVQTTQSLQNVKSLVKSNLKNEKN